MDSPKKNHSQSCAITVRTALQAGNFDSDTCYIQRNMASFDCALHGWPQNDSKCWRCAGGNNEEMLKRCLYYSDEPDWWKAFPECSSSKQCFDSRPAPILIS